MIKILIILLVLVVLVVLGFIFFVWLLVMGIGAAFENKFPMDKYDYLKRIAKSDENLQRQKDEFVGNAKEIKISKDIQDLELNDVMKNIDNLIYPNQKYSSLTCPDCEENPFWILAGWNDPIRYYAICPKCAQIVHYYDESIYDREIFERIKLYSANKMN